MNQKTKMKYTSEKGITLIALVITIIVLLILAGVTINMVLGDDGIIQQAQAAKQAQIEGENKDKGAISGATAILNDYSEGMTTEEVDNATKGEGEEEGKISDATSGVIAEVKEFDDGYVPIPKGFAYLEGNSVDEGVVVVDKYGNEFVWVPVDGENIKVGFDEGYDRTIEPTAEGLDTSKVGDVVQEYNDMKASVERYGGFYVGRYETSMAGTRVASVKNVMPMQNANWYTYYNKQKELHAESSSVVSGMIYGSQWEAIKDWMSDVPNTRYPDQLYIDNGIDMGNYWPSDRVIETGSVPEYAVKNIYDLAGNCTEFTQEGFDDYGVGTVNGRALRGGAWEHTFEDENGNEVGCHVTEAHDYLDPRICWKPMDVCDFTFTIIHKIRNIKI